MSLSDIPVFSAEITNKADAKHKRKASKFEQATREGFTLKGKRKDARDIKVGDFISVNKGAVVSRHFDGKVRGVTVDYSLIVKDVLTNSAGSFTVFSCKDPCDDSPAMMMVPLCHVEPQKPKKKKVKSKRLAHASKEDLCAELADRVGKFKVSIDTSESGNAQVNFNPILVDSAELEKAIRKINN